MSTKKLALLIFLTCFFLMDDLLLYLLFVNVYDWQINLLLLELIAIVVIAGNFSLAVVVLRILRKRPTTGAPGMIGKVGVVMRKNRGDLWVKVQGEIWRATSAQPLRRGEGIRVVEVQGLRLVVARAIEKL